MLKLIAQNGKAVFGVAEYIVDTRAELSQIPEPSVGCTVLCLEDKQMYINGTTNNWVVLPTGGGTANISSDDIEAAVAAYIAANPDLFTDATELQDALADYLKIADALTVKEMFSTAYAALTNEERNKNILYCIKDLGQIRYHDSIYSEIDSMPLHEFNGMTEVLFTKSPGDTIDSLYGIWETPLPNGTSPVRLGDKLMVAWNGAWTEYTVKYDHNVGHMYIGNGQLINNRAARDEAPFAVIFFEYQQPLLRWWFDRNVIRAPYTLRQTVAIHRRYNNIRANDNETIFFDEEAGMIAAHKDIYIGDTEGNDEIISLRSVAKGAPVKYIPEEENYYNYPENKRYANVIYMDNRGYTYYKGNEIARSPYSNCGYVSNMYATDGRLTNTTPTTINLPCRIPAYDWDYWDGSAHWGVFVARNSYTGLTAAYDDEWGWYLGNLNYVKPDEPDSGDTFFIAHLGTENLYVQLEDPATQVGSLQITIGSERYSYTDNSEWVFNNQDGNWWVAEDVLLGYPYESGEVVSLRKTAESIPTIILDDPEVVFDIEYNRQKDIPGAGLSLVHNGYSARIYQNQYYEINWNGTIYNNVKAVRDTRNQLVLGNVKLTDNTTVGYEQYPFAIVCYDNTNMRLYSANKLRRLTITRQASNLIAEKTEQNIFCNPVDGILYVPGDVVLRMPDATFDTGMADLSLRQAAMGPQVKNINNLDEYYNLSQSERRAPNFYNVREDGIYFRNQHISSDVKSIRAEDVYEGRNLNCVVNDDRLVLIDLPQNNHAPYVPKAGDMVSLSCDFDDQETALKYNDVYGFYLGNIGLVDAAQASDQDWEDYCIYHLFEPDEVIHYRVSNWRNPGSVLTMFSLTIELPYWGTADDGFLVGRDGSIWNSSEHLFVGGKPINRYGGADEQTTNAWDLVAKVKELQQHVDDLLARVALLEGNNP